MTGGNENIQLYQLWHMTWSTLGIIFLTNSLNKVGWERGAKSVFWCQNLQNVCVWMFLDGEHKWSQMDVWYMVHSPHMCAYTCIFSLYIYIYIYYIYIYTFNIIYTHAYISCFPLLKATIQVLWYISSQLTHVFWTAWQQYRGGLVWFAPTKPGMTHADDWPKGDESRLYALQPLS